MLVIVSSSQGWHPGLLCLEVYYIATFNWTQHSTGDNLEMAEAMCAQVIGCTL